MASRVKAPSVVVPLQSLFEVMSDGVLITDASGYRTFSNRTLNQLVGGDARMPLKSLDPPPWLPDRLGDRYQSYIRMALDGNLDNDIISLEWSVVNPLGDHVPVVLKLVPLQNGESPSAVLWLVVPSIDTDNQAYQLVVDRQRRLEESLKRIAQELARMGVGGESTLAVAPASLPELERLSRRERQVLDLLLEGHRVVSIAEQLCVSEHTVRNHLKSIFKKLGVHSQAELVGLVRNGR